MYIKAPLALRRPDSYVTFKITERIQRICIWINQNFLLEDELEFESENVKDFSIGMYCLRDQSRLDMDFRGDGLVKISTHDIRLAGDIVQSLGLYLNLSDLQVSKNILFVQLFYSHS